VETRRDLEDKRVVWVSVTSEAEKIVESFSQLRGEALEEVFRKWSERERSVLTNLLRRVRKDAKETRGATV
jgi:DNA-binding MarR family transcriptional regulator